MSEIRWKERLDEPRFATDPAPLFQRSREKRQEIQEQIKRFTSSNWNQQSIPLVKPPRESVPPINIPRSPKKVEFTFEPEQQKQQQQQKQQYQQQQQQIQYDKNSQSNSNVILTESINNQKPIDYSLSLKLSESGVGNKSKAQTQMKNILDEQFYELKESRMLSEQDKQDKRFPFASGVIEPTYQQQKETIYYNLRQSKDTNQQHKNQLIKQNNEVEQIKYLPRQSEQIKYQNKQNDSKTIKQQKQLNQKQQQEDQYKQTIKYSKNDGIDHSDDKKQKYENQKVEQVVFNQQIIQAQQKQSQKQQKQQQNRQQGEQKVKDTKLEQKPSSTIPINQNIPNNSQQSSKNLDNSSGKFFFTSQFKQYMQNKSNYNQQQIPPQLNQTVKSSILDKVFSQDIKAPQYIQYLDLDQLKKNDSVNKLSNLFELAYHKSLINIVEDITYFLNIISRFKKFKKNSRERKLVIYFSGIKLYQEYKKWKQTLKIQAGQFKDKQTHRLLNNCFYEWKVVSLGQYYQNNHKVDVYRSIKHRQIKYTIFKGWKMMLFHNKIQRQAVKFRLGTLFRAWKGITDSKKQLNRQAAITFYYINLMSRVFNLWKQGFHNIREENQKRYIAKTHNRRRLARIAWNSWIRYVEEQQEINGQDYVPVEIVVERKFIKNKQEKEIRYK